MGCSCSFRWANRVVACSGMGASPSMMDDAGLGGSASTVCCSGDGALDRSSRPRASSWLAVTGSSFRFGEAHRRAASELYSTRSQLEFLDEVSSLSDMVPTGWDSLIEALPSIPGESGSPSILCSRSLLFTSHPCRGERHGDDVRSGCEGSKGHPSGGLGGLLPSTKCSSWGLRSSNGDFAEPLVWLWCGMMATEATQCLLLLEKLLLANRGSHG